MSNKEIGLIVGLVGSLATSAFCAVVAYRSNKKIDELNYKLEKRIDAISDNLEVDVPDEILERALRIAAESEAKRTIGTAGKEIISEYRGVVQSEVRKSVEMAYANTKTDVKDELNRQVSNLDISGIKKEVVEEASEKAKEKLDRELETIATKFSNDLDRSSKILKVVSDKLGTTN